MHAQQIFSLGGTAKVVAHFYNRLCVFDLESGAEERLPWLRDDTGLRVALSSSGEFLVVGSWREGISLYNMITRKLVWFNDFKHVGEVAFLNGGSWVSATCSDRPGVFLFALESGEQYAWKKDYSVIVENIDLKLLLAFNRGSRKIDCLDYHLLKHWSLDWNSFSIIGSSFSGDRGVISSKDGKLGLVDFSKMLAHVVDVREWCSSIAPICFDSSGDGFIALVAEIESSENSALVALDAEGSLKRVIKSFRPERGAAFLNGGKRLIKSEGLILDTETGAVVRAIGW